MTATELRQKLYRILTEAARTGREVRVTHKGHTFRIVSDGGASIRDRLVPHDTVRPTTAQATDTDTLWEWNEERNLDGL